MHFSLRLQARFIYNGLLGSSSRCFSSAAVASEGAAALEPAKPREMSSPVDAVVARKAKSRAWEEELKRSLRNPDYFGVVNMFTLEDLFNHDLHLGHKEGSLDPHMKPYLYGSRLSHLIIDLAQTTSLLNQALNFLAHVAYRDGVILFVCRDKQHQTMIEKISEGCGEVAHTRHWRTDLLTNSEGCFKGVVRLPDLILFISTRNELDQQSIGVRDAAKMLIPTIGVVDTNCDPRLITYPVPANDDTPSSVRFLANLFADTIIAAKNKRREFLASV